MFIPSAHGSHVNTDEIESIHLSREQHLHMRNGSTYQGLKYPLDAICQIITATGWEVILEDGETTCAEPIIAWGLTLAGGLKPMIASELGQPNFMNAWAMREIATGKVAAPHMGTFTNADEWLAHIRGEPVEI